MAVITGTVTLNGINDAHLIKILQAKEQNPNFTFTPQAMQAGQINEGGQMKTVYSNAVLAWNSGDGLKTVQAILAALGS